MALSPDATELARRIADALQEKVDAVHRVLYGSTFTKSDCCKVLIRPLGKYRIDTLLESLPPNDAEPLREKHDRLMSCFDATGDLIDQHLPLTTVERYVTELTEELRSIRQGTRHDEAVTEKQDKCRPQEESKPMKERFAFRPGQVLFDDRDLNVGTGAVLKILETLVENFGSLVPFQELDENSEDNEASEKTRTAIGRLRKVIKSAKIPVAIDNRKAEGYVMLSTLE